VQARLAVDWGSKLPVFIGLGVLTFLAVLTMRDQGKSGIIMLFLGILAIVYAAYSIASAVPGKAAGPQTSGSTGFRSAAGDRPRAPPKGRPPASDQHGPVHSPGRQQADPISGRRLAHNG